MKMLKLQKRHLIDILIFSSCCVLLFFYMEISRRKNHEGIEEKGNKDLIFRIRGPLLCDDVQLLDHVRNHYLHPPSSHPYNLSKGSDLLYYKYSKESTWRFIHDYLKVLFTDEGPGFFVEAGALDGEYISNTLWLEQNLKWTGLLVEPDYESFCHLQYKNRHAWTSNTCLSNKPFPKETIHVSLHIAKHENIHWPSWNFHSNSHELGVTVRVSDPKFFGVSDKGYSAIQCFPLSTYLLALNISTVDFLSLDIQGSEKEVLSNMLWDSIKIRAMFVELTDNAVDENFINFMESKDFLFINRNLVSHVPDYLFVRKDEESLLNKLKAIAYH